MSREKTNNSFIYEVDVIHRFEAGDLSYVTIEITFVSYFISSFHRPINPPMKLETAKETPKLERREKNEAIICNNWLIHHKRASSFINTYKAAQSHFLYMFSRYSRISERV
jgi:hypothetical protein